MPLFPKIDSPCPYKSQLAAVMDGDFCRMCERQVFDLTAFSDGDRRAFLAGCAEEVCVSYRVPMRSAIAGAALAAAAAFAPAAAASQDPAPVQPAVQVEPELEEEISEDELSMVIIVGGIKDPANAELAELAEDESVLELPVAYEDELPAEASVKAVGAPGA